MGTCKWIGATGMLTCVCVYVDLYMYIYIYMCVYV